MEKNYSFFSNRECEYFPCHEGIDAEDFNCLFCYCPLYLLGNQCGGNFTYLKNGNKDCSQCIYPHTRQNYEAVVERYGEIRVAMSLFDKNNGE